LIIWAPTCNTMPKKDLHACFWTLKSSSLFGKTVGDSARMGTCDPYRRKDLVFMLCGVTKDEKGKLERPKTEKNQKDEPIYSQGCTDKEIKKYIETGAY